AVMYLGKLCEVAPAEDLYRAPLHPYTNILLASIPSPERASGDGATGTRAAGELQSPIDPPSGCRFRTRCPRAQDRCAAEEPVMRERAPGQSVACHFPLEAPDGKPRHLTRSAPDAPAGPRGHLQVEPLPGRS